MVKAFPLICVCCLLATGCPQTTPKPNPRPRGPDVALLVKSLELPPAQGTEPALTQLAALARKGNRSAQWARMRYLFDLYDFTRLTGEKPARGLLLRALGGTGQEKPGRTSTLLVMNRLVAAFEKFTQAAATAPRPGQPRPRVAAQGEAGPLLRLLRSDRDFLRDPNTLRRRLKLLKAARKGPVAAAARLRLYALCAQAFRVAARAAPSIRPQVLNHCLYVLYDFNPAPHLKSKGAPPQPPWSVYRDQLQRLLDSAAVGPRMSALVGLRTELDQRFYRRNSARLPVLLHDQIRDLPPLSAGQPYRGASALVLRPDQLLLGGRVVLRPQKRHIRVALTEAYFAGNRHTQLTLFATTALTMKRVAPVLERAAATGFYVVGFGGVMSAPSRVGYWRVSRETRPLRLREVVVSLAPISEAAATLKTLDPTKIGWDRACAKHGLGVLLGHRRATPYGPDGRLPPLLSPKSTSAALRLALSRLRAAFPTACAVRLAAEPNLSYMEFLKALVSVRAGSTSSGWRFVGYALPPSKPTPNATFASRVNGRLSAKVTLLGWPRRLQASRKDLRALIRPCYFKALDVKPARWGRLEVHSSPGKTLVSQQRGTSPEELSLNSCVSRAVDSWRKKHNVDVPLRFRVQLKP